MIEAPDVDAELVAWTPVPLARGFELEDVSVSADLSGVSAAGGRVARCRLSGVSLAGARLRSVRFVDGSLGSHTAAMHEPFTDDPRGTGLLVTPPESLYAWTPAADRAGLRPG